jgi:phosphotransferase system HPr (HPr) family protein
MTMAAAGFRSTVTLVTEERRTDARSVLGVMGLGATKGSAVTVLAEGDDADEAVEKLAALLAAITPAPVVAAPASG